MFVPVIVPLFVPVRVPVFVPVMVPVFVPVMVPVNIQVIVPGGECKNNKTKNLIKDIIVFLLINFIKNCKKKSMYKKSVGMCIALHISLQLFSANVKRRIVVIYETDCT